MCDAILFVLKMWTSCGGQGIGEVSAPGVDLPLVDLLRETVQVIYSVVRDKK